MIYNTGRRLIFHYFIYIPLLGDELTGINFQQQHEERDQQGTEYQADESKHVQSHDYAEHRGQRVYISQSF